MLDKIKQSEEEEKRKQKQLQELQEKENKANEERLKKEKLEEAERKKQQLPNEPDEKDPLACHIVFRLPVSGERVNRRFLKTDKIQLIYDFLDSLGDKIQFETTTGQYVVF